MLRDRVLDRLTWLGALVTLAAAVVLLFGPLWTTAVGENPLERAPGIDIGAVLRLALPTVVVLAAFAVALCTGRWRVAGAVPLLVMGYAVLTAPAPLPAWFLPGLVLTAAGYAVSLWRAGDSSGRGSSFVA
ncbi:hypothetical protein [Ornithinimicrobium avium]|uniref:Uncharacterized protein n=1 Tax=Ornithinimicrobium avium TaxID=2283195 RepID=A0A345NJL8_9MICO|nr:hypothetical protein [Ornithinimicrobium avium]AXH95226.1 hypothetical protein DV701_02885 [Ornithinimicrobium avium]